MKTLYLDQYTLWNYLEYMSITYANLTRLSPMIFNRSLSSPILYSIKTLNLSYNSLRSLTRNFSYYFPSLEKLDLSHNQLISIKKKTFSHLIYLKELYLNNNYLKQILSNVFPSQSLYLINLNLNSWHCTCTNVLILSISRPIPICSTPNQYQNQNASDIARQCFLRTKANILINQNLTCVLSTVIDQWKNKIIENMTIISAWHIEQRRSISFEQLSTLNNQSDKHLVCFNFNSTYPESIYTIINLPLINLTTTTPMPIKSTTKLPRLFRWILKIGKNVLPKSMRNSEKHVLIVWLILLTIAFIILIYLIYWIHQAKTNDLSRPFIRFDQNLSDHRTLFNVKLTCKNHKCLCQYRRRAHSTLYLTKSISSNLQENQSLCIQPSFIEGNQLRYAKIKRISSTNDYLTGEFRTIVKLKSLPN
jgi:hypothetical protein